MASALRQRCDIFKGTSNASRSSTSSGTGDCIPETAVLRMLSRVPNTTWAVLMWVGFEERTLKSLGLRANSFWNSPSLSPRCRITPAPGENVVRRARLPFKADFEVFGEPREVGCALFPLDEDESDSLPSPPLAALLFLWDCRDKLSHARSDWRLVFSCSMTENAWVRREMSILRGSETKPKLVGQGTAAPKKGIAKKQRAGLTNFCEEYTTPPKQR